ncbi:MAG: UvrD-helicase domain-containing protein [Bdellovibrionales bacterium]|nr:UvrD-helicase domain-containing protein [Bdellovibrionales bacterium]
MNSFIPAEQIQANAGTGKTFALTNRFLFLLNKNESPDKILATTFTKKAAGEISRRIFSRLSAAALDEKKAKDLSKFLIDDSFNSKRASQLLARLVAIQNRLQISTMDSLFYKIASSFSLEIGLVPGWNINEPGLEAYLLREAVRKVCKKDNHANIIKLLRIIDQGEFRRSIQSRITSLVKDGFDLLRETVGTEEAWEPLPRPPLLTAEELTRVIEDLKNISVPTTQAGQVNKHWQSAIDKAIKDAKESNWSDFIDQGIQKKIIAGEDVYYKCVIDDSCRQAFEPLIQHASAYFLNILGEKTKSAKELLLLFQEEFDSNKEKFRKLNFTDIKYELLSALICHEIDRLYFRLDSSIHHLLLDEFQDTSRIEWKVLWPLVDEILAKADIEHTFFCVGDTKQAIYGWRGGEARIFDAIPKVWEIVEQDVLSVSYRSSPFISDFVNLVFGEINSNQALQSYPEALALWQSRFVTHSSNFKDQAGFVELSFLESENEKSSGADFLNELSSRISELHNSRPDLSIGILTRKNSLIGSIIYALAKKGVFASEEGGIKLTDSLAVNAFLSLLTLIDHPGDGIARFHVASSPLGKILGFETHKDISAAHVLSLKLKREINKTSLGDFLQTKVKQLDNLSSLDKFRLNSLIELAYEYESQFRGKLDDFVKFISEKKVEEYTSSQVRVMTIHKSKGLEFDIVILPELDTSLVQKNFTSKFLVDYDSSAENITKISCSVNLKTSRLNKHLSKMYNNYFTNNLLDSLCTLYVALTRARFALYMYAPRSESNKSTGASFTNFITSALSIEKNKQKGIAYTLGDPNWTNSVQAKEIIEIDPKNEPTPYLKSAGLNRNRMLPRKNPSKDEASLDDILQIQVSALEFGTAVHALFEEIKWLDDFDPSILEKINLRSLRAISESALITYFKNSISKPNIDQLLRKARYDSWEVDEIKVYTERAYAYRVECRIITGIMDRLVVGYNKGKPVAAEVIDFKTSKMNDNQEEHNLTDNFKSQLQAYKLAVEKQFGLSVENINAIVAFVGTGEIVQF